MKSKVDNKDTMTVQEAVTYYKLSRRKFYELLHQDGLKFIAFYYNGRRLILKKEFERYLKEHPEIRRRERRWQENQDCEEIQNTEYSEEANQ